MVICVSRDCMKTTYKKLKLYKNSWTTLSKVWKQSKLALMLLPNQQALNICVNLPGDGATIFLF